MIDWLLISQKLAEQLQQPLSAAVPTPLTGGDINHAFRLDCGTCRFFVKLNQAAHESMFIAEREGLQAIRDSQAIRVPEVYLTGIEGEYAYLVMEYIDLDGPPDQDRLAQALAVMHGYQQPRFGFHCDNTIGSTPQVNSLTMDWVGFWREHRLGYQLELARHNGATARLIDRGSRLVENLAHFFTTYQPQASLLHGDLWGGNYGSDRGGNPVIYDPACYYGDHEADLAMMELFGRPGERFFAQYRECFPIDEGYVERRDLYNLYHLLNHSNLFGGAYASQSQQVIDCLLAQLR